MARTKRNTSMEERVAVLETIVAAMSTTLNANSAILTEINKKLSGQKGFIAGMVFVVSAAWAAILALVQYWPSR